MFTKQNNLICAWKTRKIKVCSKSFPNMLQALTKKFLELVELVELVEIS